MLLFSFYVAQVLYISYNIKIEKKKFISQRKLDQTKTLISFRKCTWNMLLSHCHPIICLYVKFNLLVLFVKRELFISSFSIDTDLALLFLVEHII